MRQIILPFTLALLAASCTAFGQRSAPGFHYGAQAGVSVVPFSGPNTHAARGAEVGGFVSLALPGAHEVQFQLTGGAVDNLPLAALEKSVYVGPEAVYEQSSFVSVSSFTFIDLSLLYSADWLSYRGFSLAGGLRWTRIIRNNGLLGEGEQWTAVQQRVSLDFMNDAELLEFERLIPLTSGGGSDSVFGPAFGTPSA